MLGGGGGVAVGVVRVVPMLAVCSQAEVKDKHPQAQSEADLA